MWPLRAAERRHSAAVRRDPAPSRLAFRIERLWLTPAFRLAMRAGVPFVLTAALVGGYFADDARRQAIANGIADIRRGIEERPEFRVSLMAIDGASEPVAEAIRGMLPVELPTSSFNLDLEAMRATIAQIDAVASAELHIRKGGILQVTVAERRPAVLWRNGETLEMLDATGHRVATLLDRTVRPDLPVIAGMGADERVGEALTILKAAAPIGHRIRGLVRMGERRWDVVLDRHQSILLPEEDPVTALQRVIALDQAEDMLGRDLRVVDMRLAHRPTVRLPETGGETEDLAGFETEVAGE